LAETVPTAEPVAARLTPEDRLQGGAPRAGCWRRSLIGFRVQWIGACSSAIGTWMQIVAQNWLVLSLTNSTSTSARRVLQQLPILFTLIGGVFADRYDKRKTR
jgi:hypothetical protein